MSVVVLYTMYTCTGICIRYNMPTSAMSHYKSDITQVIDIFPERQKPLLMSVASPTFLSSLWHCFFVVCVDGRFHI